MHEALMSDRTPTPFAAVLRNRREALGLRQEDAAKLVGVAAKTWRRWEAGDVPSGRHLSTIRERFNVSVASPADEALAEIERALAIVRDNLGPRISADVVLQRPDGATVLVEVKAFGDDLGEEAIALIGAAAHEAGWIVHVAP